VRGAFTRTLVELAERDPRILLLTGDLGYLVLEPFSEKFPSRFFNVGVAEQNMLGLATGLAEAGFIPFVYSIATFATLRPYEFIRNGPVLHQLPVRIVGVGGGFDYGPNGISHYGLEDIALMRVQPGMTVVVPADHQQARAAILAIWNAPGPVYLRLSRDDVTTVPGLDGRFELGRAQLIRDGPDLLMIAMGSIAVEVATAAERLADRGIRCTVMVVASLKPPPVEDLARTLARFRAALTVEAHFEVGGLGSLVSEVAAERGLRCRINRCGVKAIIPGVSGTQPYLHRAYRLSSDAVAELALHVMRDAAS